MEIKLEIPDSADVLQFKCEDVYEDGMMAGPVWIDGKPLRGQYPDAAEPEIVWLPFSEVRRLAKHLGARIEEV